MKKTFFASVIVLASGVALYAYSGNESAENRLAPCKKHIDQCPTGYSGGYHCTTGHPLMETCAPNECNQIIPCKPNS